MSVNGVDGKVSKYACVSSYFTMEHISHDWVGLELLNLLLRFGQFEGAWIIIDAGLVNWVSIAHAVIEGWFIGHRIIFCLTHLTWNASMQLLLQLEDLKGQLLIDLGLLHLGVHL